MISIKKLLKEDYNDDYDKLSLIGADAKYMPLIKTWFNKTCPKLELKPNRHNTGYVFDFKEFRSESNLGNDAYKKLISLGSVLAILSGGGMDDFIAIID